jgi:glycosyltransferase involved in cell wall biosynthesis
VRSSSQNESLKASIIIVNYNYGRFLETAIDSALSQTYRNYEIIVVDDGSIDNSRSVIEKYTHRLKSVYKPNGGQGSALNAGFLVSSGDLIVFLDADDVLAPFAVETIVSRCRQGVGLIRYPFEVISATGESSGEYVGGEGSRIPSAMFGPFGVDSPGGAKAFSREILERIIPIPEKLWTMGADGFLAAMSSVLGEIVCIDEPLGGYRIHGKNHVAKAKLGLGGLRRRIVSDFNLYGSLHELKHGQIASFDEWLAAYPQHWLARMISLRESPLDHPWADHASTLVRKAISATWRQPYWNVRRKIAYSGWLLAYSAAPERMARALEKIERRGAGRLTRCLLGQGCACLKRRADCPSA